MWDTSWVQSTLASTSFPTGQDEMVQTSVTRSFVETLPSVLCLKERMEYLESKIGDSADQHDKARTMELTCYDIFWAKRTDMHWYMLLIQTTPEHTRIYWTFCFLCQSSIVVFLRKSETPSCQLLNRSLTRNSARSMQRWKNCQCHRGDNGYSMAFPLLNFT